MAAQKSRKRILKKKAGENLRERDFDQDRIKILLNTYPPKKKNQSPDKEQANYAVVITR